MHLKVERVIFFRARRARPLVERPADPRFIAVATLGVTQKPIRLRIGVSASIAPKFFFHESAR
jgi:hypothetical protein